VDVQKRTIASAVPSWPERDVADTLTILRERCGNDDCRMPKSVFRVSAASGPRRARARGEASPEGGTRPRPAWGRKKASGPWELLAS
jgi:hypothetical protein